MASYTYLWEFLVSPEDEARFVEYYGPEGTWVRLSIELQMLRLRWLGSELAVTR